MRVIAGEPVDLSAFEGKPITNELLHEATEVIMQPVADELGELRGADSAARNCSTCARHKAAEDNREDGETDDQSCGVRCRVLGDRVRHCAGPGG